MPMPAWPESTLVPPTDVLAAPRQPQPSVTAPASAGIAVAGVAHTYVGQHGRVEALTPIDLRVPAGEFVALLGPSGCGKSTLLRIICGLLQPSRGSVWLASELPAAARKRRAVGWLAQEDGLLPWRTVLENVDLPRRLAHQGDPEAALALLRRVGLDGSARQYPHELSGGMRQRAALARALVAHSVGEAVRLADRVVVLSPRPGRLVLDVALDLAQPRAEHQPRFGALVQRLKRALRPASTDELVPSHTAL